MLHFSPKWGSELVGLVPRIVGSVGASVGLRTVTTYRSHCLTLNRRQKELES